jgi:hypothetical protein
MGTCFKHSRIRAQRRCHVLLLEAGWQGLAPVLLVAIHKLLWSLLPSIWA